MGRVIGPHGVRGEVRVALMTDFPERFRRIRQLYVGDEESTRELRGVRFHKGQALLTIADVDSRSAADLLRGRILYVPAEDAEPLPEGTYFLEQILGIEVQTSDGTVLGKVTEILRTGSNDVYVVQGAEGEVLLPAIHDVVRKVDLAAGLMTVELLEGLR